MGRHATSITLTPEEHRELGRRVRARTSRQQAAVRARIVLRAAEGAQNTAMSAELGCARHTVQHRGDRFGAERLAGLVDPPAPPPACMAPSARPRSCLWPGQAPADRGWAGQTHRSSADMAQDNREHPEVGVGRPSKRTAGTILQAHDLRLDRL